MHDGLTELAELSLQLQNRSISHWNSNTCIKRKIHMLNLIANQHGPRAEETSYAYANLIFKNVPMINYAKIPKINSCFSLFCIFLIKSILSYRNLKNYDIILYVMIH